MLKLYFCSGFLELGIAKSFLKVLHFYWQFTIVRWWDLKGKRYRADFRWTSATVEDRARSSRENQIPSSAPKNTAEKDTFSAVFFYPLRKQWHIIAVGVYHHRRCISSTVGCITFAMMIYSSENEICSFSNGWYAISMKLVIYKATPWFVCESVIQ